MPGYMGPVWLMPGGSGLSASSSPPTLVTLPLPQAVLAATIIVNLKGMLMQLTDIRSLWKANRMDLVRGLGPGCLQPQWPH